MESLEESNCHSMSDSFSLYERYLRSFKVVENLSVRAEHRESSEHCEENNFNEENIALCDFVNKHYESAVQPSTANEVPSDNIDRNSGSLSYASPAPSFDNFSVTADHSLLNEKSDPIDVPVTSEEFKSERSNHPMFITSTMENSNNAVDSVPLFHNIRPSESVFKLPIRELSFNGTIKHIQKLKPIVDPISALSTVGTLNLDEKSEECMASASNSESVDEPKDMSLSSTSGDRSINEANRFDKTESYGDSQYEDLKPRIEGEVAKQDNKWNPDRSFSSLESSFDSGVRSPDMFSDDGEFEPAAEPFWNFLKDYEAHDKRKLRRVEELLQGVPPPPSVTVLRTDVTEMLKKYYCFLPAFNDNSKITDLEATTVTPTKKVSFIQIPEQILPLVQETDIVSLNSQIEVSKDFDKESINSNEADIRVIDKSIQLDMCSEEEAKIAKWPDLLKCNYHDVYYNVTRYSEKLELMSLRYAERYVGAETDTSVNIHSGGLQSPSSAHKRKAMRIKMSQVKSPGRRLSHLARRRQAFCNAANISEKVHSNSKMVLIDKNFFPHRKLINSSDRKSPRFKRTPGKKTPVRKTPGKKTPVKTPKTRNGGSSRKKAMRRLLLDSESMTRSQPTRESLKRALFVSPENRKTMHPAPSTSVPIQAMRSKRALFSSPVREAETKSLDGSQSDHFLKRKLDALDGTVENSRSKIAKSLSFGGDAIGNTQSYSFVRRASEVFSTRNTAELNDIHKKKLMWAVSEALRLHGWRMSSPGFREKASTLARLTRRLLTLPPHAARFAAPTLSTSDTMFKLARRYVFAIIQGRTVEDCFEEEQAKLAHEANTKISGYISANAYQQFKDKQATTSQIKENTCFEVSLKQEQPRSGSTNILKDKLVNIDSNSNSSGGFSMLDKSSVYKSNSMPSFEEAAKMRARRQISFDNVEFPKR